MRKHHELLAPLQNNAHFLDIEIALQFVQHFVFDQPGGCIVSLGWPERRCFIAATRRGENKNVPPDQGSKPAGR
ncbi:MAG: hypothetical protein J0I19_08095 [Alphaproteobacteria bacterium]|nr:hypothetical protein [Alphaproteobacteria bacterium]